MTESIGRLPSEFDGPLRGKRIIENAHTNGFSSKRGFLLQAQTAGNLQYRTLEGKVLTEPGVPAGHIVNAAGIPVVCTEVLAAGTTVETVVIGVL